MVPLLLPDDPGERTVRRGIAVEVVVFVREQRPPPPVNIPVLLYVNFRPSPFSNFDIPCPNEEICSPTLIVC
jgi:hypothetical protein